MRQRGHPSWALVAAALTFLGAACGAVSPVDVKGGHEQCSNGHDDNGDGKVDCVDPDCFSDPSCSLSEQCDNARDDDGDGASDCADSSCDGQSCGVGCVCVHGVAMRTDAGVDAGVTPGDAGVCTHCGQGCECRAGNAIEVACFDGVDNDDDGPSDCADADCQGASCGAGCTCASSTKKEVLCSDRADNDGDGRTDCLDPDCAGTGTEVCNNGIDDNCDRAIDCADAQCSSTAQCANLSDGAPCVSDGQCAGGRCRTEGVTGTPNGACANSGSCTLGTTEGCHGGLCERFAGGTYCRARCSGTSGCRPGFVCFNPDALVSNDNNVCVVACEADEECSGGGSGYGCNPWSRICTNKDRGRPRYGAACTDSSQCETDFCNTGAEWPGGYCVGPCRGDTRHCGTGGACVFDATLGDNFGVCMQTCASCRVSDQYACHTRGDAQVCACNARGQSCTIDAECCSNFCGLEHACL